MCVSTANSCRIANLSFACACCIVLVHVPWTFGAGDVRSLLAMTALQYFYVVAGYLLARHFGEPDWWRTAVFRRVKSLLVPYALWMAIATVLLWMTTGERPLGLGNSGLDLRKVPLVVPLWFVRSLFLLVLASPLIRRAVERWGRGFLLAAFLAAGAVSSQIVRGGWTVDDGWGGLFVHGFPLEGLFYFAAGMWLQANPVSVSGRGRRAALILAALAAVALRLTAGACRWPAPFDLNLVAVPFCLAALWCVTPTVAWPQVLTGSSFPIYVMHAVVLGVVWTVPALNDHCPFAVAVACGILIPMIVSDALKRMVPRVAKALFGGRV